MNMDFFLRRGEKKNLKKFSLNFFQVEIHFHPGYQHPTTLANSVSTNMAFVNKDGPLISFWPPATQTYILAVQRDAKIGDRAL